MGVTIVSYQHNISGLLPNTTYYYRAVAQNNAGKKEEAQRTFQTVSAPPAVITTAATDVLSHSVRLNGKVNPNGADTTYYFEYGTTITYGLTTSSLNAGSGINEVLVNYSISGLEADTAYHYRLVATNVNGTHQGNDEVFVTSPENIIELENIVRVPEHRGVIQDAIDAVGPFGGSGAVIVAPGEYIERPIRLRSGVLLIGSGAEVTTIKPNDSGVVIEARDVSNSTISGFTLTGGGSSGGIYCENVNSIHLINNRIVNNYYGIALRNSSPIIISNEVSESDTDGIDCLDGSSPLIKNNLIFNNGSVGIECQNSSSPAIINNVTAYNGLWGIHAQDFSNPVIMNDIIFNNGNQGIVAVSNSNPAVDYNLITPNQFSGITLGQGNIVGKDPLFVDIANHNYHLQSSSPAIDAGNPDSAYNDNPETQQGGVRNDMGAYGGPDGIYDAPPIADFSEVSNPNPGPVPIVKPIKGKVPFKVSFLNKSFGEIHTYLWDLGDSGTSNEPSPSHTYTEVGDYNVALTVVGPGGATRRTRKGYIHVEPVAPIIRSLNPETGPVGTPVTITGEHFGASQGNSTVTFSGVNATSITSWSDTQIVAVVPQNATTGPVVVTVNGHASNSDKIFTVPSFLIGDANNDGVINEADATWVLQAVVGLREVSPADLVRCDVTGDGTCSALDAALILQYTVGIITKFPAESATAAAPSLPTTGTTYALRVGALAATPGERVSLPISLASGEGLLGGSFRITYDPSLMAIHGVRRDKTVRRHDFSRSLAGTARPDLVMTQSDPPGSLIVTFGRSEALRAGHPLATLDVEVLPTASLNRDSVSFRIEGLTFNEGIQVPVTVGEIRLLPIQTALLPNYPNPFNPETWIPYDLAEPSVVVLTIYNVHGNRVRTVTVGNQPAGMYRSKGRAAYWDGRNEAGEAVASGVYFYTLQAGTFAATHKMVIRK